MRVVEIADLHGDGVLDLQVLRGASSGLLGSDDMDEAGAALDPGSTAALLVHENLWAIPFATALHRAGAQLVESGRIPVDALLDALDSVETNEPAEV